MVLFHAENGAIVDDPALINNVAFTDTSLNDLVFPLVNDLQTNSQYESIKVIDVIEVQHGDSWDDYRPARPEDFVGRAKHIDKVFSLFTSIRKGETNTRVFALTGNSGMGKSSLISKLRDKSKNRVYRDRVFVFAVDLRAATSSDYVYSSLLACLERAKENGFGSPNINLKITDLTNPLSSPAIKDFLQSIKENDQIVCLVFDQFEELSTKPELFQVFEKAKALFFGTNSANSNFCMGFAWKTDVTLSGDSPAYHLWHELDDLRITYPLQPFTDGECKAALNIFEKVIQQKLQSDLRHNLLVISAGYPWILKKLCIHLHGKRTLREAMEIIKSNPNFPGIKLGEYLSEKYSLGWTEPSKRRNGNGIRQWSIWLLNDLSDTRVPKAPGRLHNIDGPKLDFG